MKFARNTVALTSLLALIGCADSGYRGTLAQKSAESGKSAKSDTIAQGRFILGDGSPAGNATLSIALSGVTLSIDAANLPPGVHGLHLHTTGSCEAPGFTSAGGHLNPQGNSHGKLSPNGSHLGDLPNLQVEANGASIAAIPIEGAPNEVLASIFDTDGTAVMIHADPDDYKTDPTGAAGGRIACAVLKKL